MLYLITGANGAGKTLNTLKWVRERSVKEGRPVCHNGRFEPVEGGELESWKKIDMKSWQDEPDGTIFLVDECHNDFPLRPPSGTPPDYVRMLAEHRRRGFDFYLVTQHPQNIDSFVRRLIGSPGWHRHLKRTFGADLVSVLEWNAVNPNCEKDGSGKSGTVTMQAFPKEVYTWYRSASLHTGKKRIPRAVWMLAACALLVPAFGYLAITKVYGNVTKHVKPQEAQAAAPTAQNQPGTPQRERQKLTTDEYIADRAARLKDFPHTAPAYDDVTKPTEAPYPAACVQMGKTCKCYTQQATLLQVSGPVCLQIVAQGFFMDWKTATKAEYGPRDRGDYQQARQSPPAAQQGAQSEPPRTVPTPMPAARPEPVKPVSEWSQGLAARNAQVRSSLTQ
jgi:zona occludens toxin